VPAAPIPANEPARLAALRRYMLLDTLPEPEFDRVTALAARMFDVPIALVSLVDADRQWFKSCVGLADSETSRDLAFCAHALFDPAPLVVTDARLDPRFASNPYVIGEPHVRFYAGAPLMTPDGFALGTLCVIDQKPRTLDSPQLANLAALAALVVDLVEARLGFRAREMFEQVAELSPDVIYVFDLVTKRNVYGNREMTELLGYAPGSAGSHLLGRALHPDDASASAAHFERFATLADGASIELVFRVRDATGAYRLFRARETVFERDAAGRPIKTLGVASDITAERRAEKALRAKTRLLEAILASAGEAILAADEHGAITLHNRAAVEILGAGVTLPDAAMRHEQYGVYDLDGTRLPREELPLACAIRGVATDGRELMVRRSNAPGHRYLLASGRPLVDDDGAHIGGVVTFRDVTALKTAQHALAELAVTDELTGLPNKRALRERLDQLAREGTRGRRFAVVIADVDHFKRVNDVHGHQVGDQVLAGVGAVLKASIRATDFVGRYGGEEFVVLYTDVDEDIAAGLADKLRRAIAAIEQPLRITASFGVCSNTGELAGDANGLLEAADAALYRAKHAGRDRVIAHHQR
jgi:diguanylate cyclase